MSKSLFVYTLNGNLIRSINKQGKGYGEYIDISDFNVNKYTNEFYILDAIQKKILIYSKTENFLKDIDLGFYANSFIISNDNKLVFDRRNIISPYENSSENYNLILTDKEGNIENEFIEINKDLSTLTFGPMNGLINFNNEIKYLPPLSNTIYTFNHGKSSFDIKLNLDFGRLWPSEEFLLKNISTNPLSLVNLIQEEGLVNFLNFCETDDCYYLFFYAGYDELLAVIPKNRKSFSLYLLNDAFFEPLPLIVDETENYLVNSFFPASVNSLEDTDIIIPQSIRNDTGHFYLFKYQLNSSK